MDTGIDGRLEERSDDEQGGHARGVSRRDALRGAALVGLSVLGAGALSACSPSGGEGGQASGGDTAGGGAGGGADVAWDKEADVLVVGSGTVIAAAIAASELGSKKVLIVEKDPAVFGGTSSTSGGGHAFALLSFNADEGINDTRDQVLEYMRGAADGRMDPNVQEAFVDTCDEYAHFMLDTLGWSKWGHLNKAFGDYYEVLPGALPDGFGHGSWYPFDAEGTPLMAPQQWPVYREYVDTHENIELLMGATARSLIVEGGAVIGAIVNDGSNDLKVKAAAVVLGTGGFEHDADMRRLHLAFPYYRSNGFVNNTGDAQRMGARIGARLAYMDRTFGCPHFVTTKEFVPDEFSYDQAGSDAFAPRGFPHSLMVNHKGRRFHDESAMYDTAARAFGTYDTGSDEFVNIPGYWIADAHFSELFTFPGTEGPGEVPEFVQQFDTLEALAEGMGIDKDALLDEVATFNANAAQGVDPIWHRGKPNSNNTLAMMGAYRLVPGATLPESVLGVVDKPPFYCMRYVPGMMGGTRGGLHINENAQVLDVDGVPIAGLYAAGNCSSGVAGYWAGGATLGQGTVLAYLAAKHITSQ
ncbi:MAG: FAD-binding protein [Coriobacteriales bacterium]|jgi:succinate dehydrogenase/fumarate reductase flavoprotein subunit|nr:FAD-binding protein [Coriobacteriales bacterium]